MKKVKIIVPLLVAFVLLFSLAACNGGEQLASADAWGKAFSDTDTEIQSHDANLTITAKMTAKTSDGENVVDASVKVKCTYAQGRAKFGDTYYERIEHTTRWIVYQKNEDDEYEKSESAYGPDIESMVTYMSLFPDGNDYGVFVYKNGKYELFTEKYLNQNGSGGSFVKGLDKLNMEVSFQNGKLKRVYFYAYEHLSNNEITVEVNYKFGGASVKLPKLPAKTEKKDTDKGTV